MDTTASERGRAEGQGRGAGTREKTRSGVPNGKNSLALAKPSQRHPLPLRACSAPPVRPRRQYHYDVHIVARFMLSEPAHAHYFDDDDWTPPSPQQPRLYRAASVGSWGVTSFGRGFDWDIANEPQILLKDKDSSTSHQELDWKLDSKLDEPLARKRHAFIETPPPSKSPALSRALTAPTRHAPQLLTTQNVSEPTTLSPLMSRASSPLNSTRPTPSQSPSSPRPRRRSSQQRVSLIAGRVSIAPIEAPSSPPGLPLNLRRLTSSSSVLRSAASTRAPTPSSESQSFIGGRSISEFVIEGEIGRGAYGLVKRAREILEDGSLGPPLVIKQVIKSRILADCWKKHPKHGTIPIEIYVMSAISSTSYVLPPRRPWNPERLNPPSQNGDKVNDDEWVEGKVVHGHPNICPLNDFFEDQNYYYLVLPSTTPEHVPNEPPPPSDLFDLVEAFPHGLPPSSIRSYLGQIADALCFLHSQGIVHRDVKDENVVLGPNGKCILIDFGSSGLVKKSGWDTFSGTLDYAGPEILRGERYYGKEQDVWAFGVVAYVLLVGECPFMTPAEAQEGFSSPFANASISLDERCGEGKEEDGREQDGGGALGDAAALVRACLHVDVDSRPTFDKILQCRFLAGNGGW